MKQLINQQRYELFSIFLTYFIPDSIRDVFHIIP